VNSAGQRARLRRDASLDSSGAAAIGRRVPSLPRRQQLGFEFLADVHSRWHGSAASFRLRRNRCRVGLQEIVRR
jgi:hypothetical protein